MSKLKKSIEELAPEELETKQLNSKEDVIKITTDAILSNQKQLQKALKRALKYMLSHIDDVECTYNSYSNCIQGELREPGNFTLGVSIVMHNFNNNEACYVGEICEPSKEYIGSGEV